MTSKQWQGVVTLGDECRVGFENEDGAVLIDGHDIIGEIDAESWANPVIVGIGDERFLGELDVDLGWGYSEYTPMDSDKLKVGTHDLVEVLRRMENKIVVVTISDESINLVEVREAAVKELPQ